jgi:hypothetical protein
MRTPQKTSRPSASGRVYTGGPPPQQMESEGALDTKSCSNGKRLAGQAVGLLEFGKLDSCPEVDFVEHRLELGIGETLLARLTALASRLRVARGIPPASRPSRTWSSMSSNCSPCEMLLERPLVESSSPCKVRIDSTDAIGPGADTVAARASSVASETLERAAAGGRRALADAPEAGAVNAAAAFDLHGPSPIATRDFPPSWLRSG